ncbi:MAG: peptidylprolyl isomerase [Cocleimonas sp.]
MMIFKVQTAKQSRIKHHKSCFFLSALLILCITTSSSSHAAEQAMDGIAAVVNSDVIMVSELKAAAKQAQSANELPEGQLYKQVLEQLIMDKIQVQKAKAIGIKIDDAAVNTAMESIAKQNNLDLQQLRVAIIERGLNYKEFRESIRDRLYSDTLRKRQQGRNNIGENEVDDLIQAESFNLSKDVQYQLVDIIIPNKTNSVKQFNANLKRAQSLRNKLLLNKDLSSPEIVKMGAIKKDLGWQNAETLSPAYSRTLSLMGEGELSTVIRDTKGFHILKLVKQRGGKSQQTQEARVRHILISNDDPKAKLKVTLLRNKILAGESFSQLATKNSADKGSASNGGELPMTNTANYVPSFAAATNTLALNSLSQPIQTKFGWHIIEVLERKSSDKTRESIKNQAKQLVGTKKREDDLKNWLKTLRDEAFVEYRLKL